MRLDFGMREYTGWMNRLGKCIAAGAMPVRGDVVRCSEGIDLIAGGGNDYSGLVSELPEKAATMAGEMTIATKVRPIRRSCIGVAPWWGSSELFHSLMMPEVT
jgi:hypothetical protein